MTISERLADLELAWMSAGVPIRAFVDPGASVSEVRSRLRAESLHEGEGPVAWFSWQGGTTAKRWHAAPLMEQLLSLELSLSTRARMLSSQANLDSGQNKWDPDWLPITNTGYGAYHALSALDGQVLFVDYWNAEQFVKMAAEDLSKAVEIWLVALARGNYEWTAAGWTRDLSAIPANIRNSLLIEEA